MIFTGTRSQAHRLHVLLGLLGVRCSELHGALPQPQRLAALQSFKDQQSDILIATDVAARGLDISGVKTVINFVMPATVEHYIHRVCFSIDFVNCLNIFLVLIDLILIEGGQNGACWSCRSFSFTRR